VNHDPASVGRPFGGALEVRIIDPDDRITFERNYPAGSTEHRVPMNYGDKLLEEFVLESRPLRSWRLQVRVADGDPDFVTARTEISLRKQRYDPGMGGLVNYVMIVPAGIFLFVALLFALPLGKAGNPYPLIATVLASVAFLIFLA
jgi:hypothetical protein